MEMFRRFFFAAVLAGTVAGLFSAAIQQWRVVPLILEAEQYEVTEQMQYPAGRQMSGVSGEVREGEAPQVLLIPQTSLESAPHPHTGEEEANSDHPHDLEATRVEQNWMPQEGLERLFYTVVSTLLVSLGFAFLLVGVSVLTNLQITVANGIMWGLAGFVTFSLMPAIGLAPELPGMEAADLGTRQFWWWGTVLSTGGGLLVLARFSSAIKIPVAIGLLLIPHLVGAPIAPPTQSDVPALLASTFAANALFASLAFWVVLGVVFGWANQRNMKKFEL